MTDEPSAAASRSTDGGRSARRLLAGPLAICVLCGVALSLRLHGLGDKALWADEFSRVTWAKGFDFQHDFGVFASETGIRLPPRPPLEAVKRISDHLPPLYGLMLNCWLWLVGDAGDFVVRLPSAILSTAAVLVAFLALRERFGRAAALFAAAFTALSPFQIVYAQEANHYALAYFLVSLSFLFYFRLIARRAGRDGIFWALASLAALYTHYYCGFVILFQWASLVWPHRLSWKNHLPPMLLVAIGFAPYLPAVRGQLSEIAVASDPINLPGAQFFLDHVRSHVIQPFFGPMGAFVGWGAAAQVLVLSILLVIVAIRRAPRVEGLALLLNLLGPVLVIHSLFWLFRTSNMLLPRYQLFFGFAFVVLVGIALASFARGSRVVSASVLLLLVVGNAKLGTYVHREDWRTLASRIDESPAPDEPVFVHPENLTYAIARYLKGENRLFGIEGSGALEEEIAAILDIESESDGAWYAAVDSDRNETDSRVRRVLRAFHRSCQLQPVDRGSAALTLLHCTGRRDSLAERARRLETASDRSWRLPRPGPRLEAGWVDVQNRTSATGWAWSTSGLRAIRVIRGDATLAEFPHPGLERAFVSRLFPAVPADLAVRSGFRIAIRPRDGDIRTAKIVAVRADGTPMEIASP